MCEMVSIGLSRHQPYVCFALVLLSPRNSPYIQETAEGKKTCHHSSKVLFLVCSYVECYLIADISKIPYTQHNTAGCVVTNSGVLPWPPPKHQFDDGESTPSITTLLLHDSVLR